jgi:hypothetical protein
MNPEAQAILDKITSKELSILTKDDIAFLKARIDYLTPEQLEKYDSVLQTKKKKA